MFHRSPESPDGGGPASYIRGLHREDTVNSALSASQIARDLSVLEKAFPLGLAQQPHLRPGERRPVAVLFFNLRGIDSLEDLHSVEQPMQLRNGMLRLLGRLVEAYGGYVDKYTGGRIMALFGARLAGENDAVRAAETALRMMDTVEEVCESFGLSTDRLMPVAGITFGEVTVAPDPSGHLTATGTPVNLAARLEGLAGGGEILAGPQLRAQCRDAIEWDSLGQRDIKGLSDPVAVHRLSEMAGPGTGWNPVRVYRQELAFVNRTDDLATLTDAISPHLEGRAGKSLLVVLEGEAGLGKSRLARQALQSLQVTGVPTGHTRPYAQPPFWMWTTLLQHLLGDRAGGMPGHGDLTAFLEEAADPDRPFSAPETEALAYLLSLPEAEGMEQLGDRLRRERIRLAVAKLVGAMARSGRNVLMLEDLQWADAASLEMLSIVLSADAPVVAVATAREIPSGLRAAEAVRVIHHELQPLAEEHCVRLASEALATEAPRKDPRQSPLHPLIERYCGGNPLFVEELAGAMTETGLLAVEENRLRLRGELDAIKVPSTLSALVRARLDKLPRHLRTAAQVAAVIGDDLDGSLASAVLERLGEHGTSTGSVDDLIELGILTSTPGGALAFRHGMVRSAAYESILHANRRLLHRLVAEEAEASLRPRPEVAAVHWYAAGDVVRAMPRQIEAVDRAFLSADHETQRRAIRKTEAWLEEFPEGEDTHAYRHRLMYQELRILEDEGNIEEAEKTANSMLELAREHGDSRLIARALNALGQFLNSFKNADLDRAEECFRESLEIAERIGDRGVQSDALGNLANLAADTGNNDDSYELNRKALKLRLELGDLERAASTHTNLAQNLDRMGRTDEAIENFLEARRIQEEIGNVRGMGYTTNGLAITCAIAGDLDRAEEYLKQALECHRSVSNSHEVGTVLSNLGTLYKNRGELELAQRYRTEALEVCRATNNPRGEAILLENIGNTAREMGDYDKAEDYLDKALALCRELELLNHLATVYAMQGLLALDRGDTARSTALYRKAEKIISSMGTAREFYGDFCHLRDRLREAGVRGEDLPLPGEWE
jgi:class 3 adenylate cyclase/tetratricopeptide (TPR) repeat protein